METNNNNKYGNLLDKYMDSNHVNYEIKQQREGETENKYGHLLDYAKPDYSTLELMAKIEDNRIERRKQEAKEKECQTSADRHVFRKKYAKKMNIIKKSEIMRNS